MGEAINADDAFEKINALKPDLLFFRYPNAGKNQDLTCWKMLDSVPKVIFTTAFDEYALKAFEVNALDYVLKPIQPERLNDALKKLSKKQVG